MSVSSAGSVQGLVVEATYRGEVFKARVVRENPDGKTVWLSWLNDDGSKNGTCSKAHPKANIVKLVDDAEDDEILEAGMGSIFGGDDNGGGGDY